MKKRCIPLLLLMFCLSFLCGGCSTQTKIVYGVPSRDANEIVVLLVSKGITATKIPVTAGAGAGGGEQQWDIAVNGQFTTEALAILNQAGLPKIRSTSLLDLFSKQSLVPSELQERIRYQEGLSEQLASTIRKMDGVLDANVQISFPTEDLENIVPLTASVYIKHRNILDNPNSIVLSKIKRLVSSAVPGLEAESVTVIGDRSSFSEISINGPWGLTEEIDYISIWGIIMSKGSVWKFRMVFYVFILALFMTISVIGWIAWKVHAVILAADGGLKSILSPLPYAKALANPVPVAAGADADAASKDSAPKDPAPEEEKEDSEEDEDKEDEEEDN